MLSTVAVKQPEKEGDEKIKKNKKASMTSTLFFIIKSKIVTGVPLVFISLVNLCS